MFDCKRVIGASGELQVATGSSMYWGGYRSDLVATVDYHRYAKQSSAELIAEGAIS